MNSPMMPARLALPRRRAMTLVEILVVMSVMIVLVSAVVVAVFRIYNQGPVKGTQGLLLKIVQGMEQYKSIYRMYPPQDTAVNITQSGQVQASSGALWMEISYYNDFVSVAAGNLAPGGTFTDPRSGAIQTWYYFQDAWNQPLLYLCGAPYTQYSLTSAGPDLILGTADDIGMP